MVGLNPGKFYGRLLPRPRIYCDVKFSDARVDPPQSVNAALLEWAGDASWRMGGTAAKRKRMSGKIEGRMSKLRAMDESDDEEVVAPKEKKGIKKLSFFKRVSPDSGAEKSETPIERMMSSPKSKQDAATRRPKPSKTESEVEKEVPLVRLRPRRNRTEQVVEDSDCDSDDETEGLARDTEEQKNIPTRVTRRTTRLTSSLPPSTGRAVSSLSPLRTPTSQKRKRVDIDLNLDSDNLSQNSDSLVL